MSSSQERGGSRRKSGPGERSKRARADSREGAVRPQSFGLGAVNVVLLAAAAAAIIAGYVLLDRGSVTAAPLLLVLGYVVLVPAGLLVGSRRGDA